MLEDRVSGSAPSTDFTSTVETAKSCVNCGAALRSRFCPDCGQPAQHGRHTLSSLLMRGALTRLLNVDGGFLHTAWRLTVAPAVVLREYLSGRTAPYTHPVAYLFITFAAFTLLAPLFGGSFGGSNSGNRVMTALLVPLVALASRLFFQRMRHSYAEHLIIALYLFAQIALFFTLLLFLTPIIARYPGAGLVTLIISVLVSIGYFCNAYSRLFERRPVLAALGGLAALAGGAILWGAVIAVIVQLARTIGS